MVKKYKVRKIVRGKAKAEAIVSNSSFSFLGDIDMGTSEIIAEDNPNKGMTVKDKVLIYKETKGSTGGSEVLITLAQNKMAPAAIVTAKPVDYVMAEGAITTQIPFVCEPDGDILNEIKTGDIVSVNADEGILEVLGKTKMDT